MSSQMFSSDGFLPSFFPEILFVMEAEPDIAWSNNASFTIFLLLSNEFAQGEPFVGSQDIHALPSSEAPIVTPLSRVCGVTVPYLC